MTEQVTANGFVLNDLVSNVEDIAGLLRTPKRRGDNLDVPGRHGKLRVPNKLYDSGELVLPFWLVGCDPQSGEVLGGEPGVAAFYERVDLLGRIFNGDTVTLEHTLPDGSVRRCLAEISDVMEFTRQLGSPLTGRFSVALTIPGAFWTDTSDTLSSWSSVTGIHHRLTEFAAATAPCDELTITFTGPVNNPELTQLSVGTYVAYDDVIAAGRKLVVDTRTWRLDPGDGTAWTPNYAKFRHGGAYGRWFQLMPETNGPELTYVHTGGGSAAVSVLGPRKYLSG